MHPLTHKAKTDIILVIWIDEYGMGKDQIRAVELGDCRRTVRLCDFLDKASQDFNPASLGLPKISRSAKPLIPELFYCVACLFFLGN